MKILVIAPHADDEVLGLGGTIAKYIDNGDDVFVCIVTRGVEPIFSNEIVNQIRYETYAAHALLKIAETYYLDLPAVMLEDIPRYELNSKILDVIKKVSPDIVYIPHFGDMQKDHQIVAEAAMVCIRPRQDFKIKKVYSYETLSETEWNIPHGTNVFIPNVFSDISLFLDTKLKTMECYSSQISDFPNPRSLQAIKALAEYRGSTIQVQAAEAFMLIREIH